MMRREAPETLSASGGPLREPEVEDRLRARRTTAPTPVTLAGIAALVGSYLYDSWIRTTGAGWTRPQVFIGYVSSLAFPLMLLAYAAHADLRWSIAQMAAASLIAWDLCGGAIGYNHPAMKERSRGDPGRLRVLHHNLQHIHPLVLIFFQDPRWLPGLTAYWFATFLAYVEFLEPDPSTARRRIGRTGEIWTVVFEIAIALAVIGASFRIGEVPSEIRTYGIFAYGALVLSTLVVIHVPVPFQRTVAALAVVFMTFAGLFVVAPEGFGWLLPVYGLKLLVGYAAKEDGTKLPGTRAPTDARRPAGKRDNR